MAELLLINGEQIDKLEAHKKGLQHFAFSVFLFNKKGELLIQKRAKNKYHSGGLWSNSCCSHFANLQEFSNKDFTCKKRLKEELGIDFNGNLEFIDIFSYKADVDNGLVENEVDYIYKGFFEDIPELKIKEDEVENIKYVEISDLKKDISVRPDIYTTWLKLICKKDYF